MSVDHDVTQRAVRSLARAVERTEIEQSLAQLLPALGGSGECLYRADLEAGVLHVASSSGLPDVFPGQVPLDSGGLALAAVSGRPEVVEPPAPTARARRCAVVPLRRGERLLGVWAVAYPESWQPVPDELAALATIGDVLSASLDALEGAERERALLGQLETLTRGGVAIAEALAVLPEPQVQAAVQRGFYVWPYARSAGLPRFLQEILGVVVEQARLAGGAQYAALGIGESRDHAFEPWVFSGMAPEVAAAIGRFPRPVGTLGLVVEKGETVRLRDVHEHGAFRGLPAHHPDITSFLGVPIRYRQLTLGNLYLANKLGAEQFTDSDRRIIEVFASYAGLVLQHVFLRNSVESQGPQLQSILDGAPVGILFIDGQSGHVMANARAMHLLGRTVIPSEGRAQYAGLLCDPDGRPLSPDELPSSEVQGGKAARSRELLIVRPDGVRTPVVERAAPVHDLDGRPLGVMVMFEDISPLKALERVKEDMAAMVAHDLRNPIQTILLEIQPALKRSQHGEVRLPESHARRIEQSSVRLAQMAGQLLDVVRVEARRVALDLVASDVSEVVAEVIERIRPTLGPHPVEVRAEGHLPLAPLDHLRFDQILTNLLLNAAEHSPGEAPIFIHLRTEGGGVNVAVEDRGSGMPPAILEHLFDRFYQARQGRKRKTKGLGLGLYIVRGLVEAHGGRIGVESQPGRGTIFHVWFPAARAEETSAPAPP